MQLGTVITLNEVHPWWEKLRAYSGGGDGMFAFSTEAGFQLILCMSNLSAEELRSFDNCELGLYPLQGGYVWLFKTTHLAFDAPFCPLLEPEGSVLTELDTPNMRYSVTIQAIDQGIVRHLRFASVSVAFSRLLRSLHERAIESGVTRAQWEAERTKFQDRFPHPQFAFRKAAVICRPGD